MLSSTSEDKKEAQTGLEHSTTETADCCFTDRAISSRLQTYSKSVLNLSQPTQLDKSCSGCLALAAKLNKLEVEVKNLTEFIHRSLPEVSREDSMQRITRSKTRGILHNESPKNRQMASKSPVKSSLINLRQEPKIQKKTQ